MNPLTKTRIKIIAACTTLALISAGCASYQPSNQQIGTAAGAVVGGAAGHVLFGNLLGTVGGAAAGAVIGNEVGK